MNTELSLYDYWRIINKRKWSALIIIVLSVLSSYIYTKFQPIVYSSSAIINTQAPNIYNKMPGADVMEDPYATVSTEIRVINSIEIASRACEKLNMKAALNGLNLNFKPTEILSSYNADRVQDSNLISITARTNNPYKANDIVQAVIEAYREYDLEQKSAQAKKTLNDIIARKTEIEDKLRSLERQKKEFMEKNPRTGMGAYLADQLSNLESERKELLEKYTPNHPEVVIRDKKIELLQQKIAQSPAQDLELARISRDLNLQEELYATISKQYEETKLGLSSIVSFVRVVNPPYVNLTPVSPNKKLNLIIGFLLGVFLSIVFVFLMENLDVSINTIEEIESFLSVPVLGIIPNISSENKMDNILTDIFKRERFSIDGFRSALLVNSKYSFVMEFYHTLRANIISNMNKRGAMSIVFSSSGAAEGKTLTAINFALASANSGLRTLLIDGDLRRPVINQVFGLNKSPGLSEVLAERIDYNEAIKGDADLFLGDIKANDLLRFHGIENLKIMTSGYTPSNIVDLLDNANWPKLMDNLKSEFDIIVLDAPPVLLFVDAIIMSKKNDGSVLVYKAGKIARGALKRAKDQIVGVDAKMIGVVLNGVRTSEMGPKYASYSYDYSKYARPVR